MPIYSYLCTNCGSSFEVKCSISEYKESSICSVCSSLNTHRNYKADLTSLSSSVIKADDELKTLGDLANRNRDKMSEDKRQQLHKKHNEYKDSQSTKELPKGMSRIKRPSYKPKWR